MACFFCSPFTKALLHSHHIRSPYEELRVKGLSLSRFPSQSISRIGMEQSKPNSLINLNLEIDSGWHANLTAPCRLLCNSIFNYYSVYSSTKMVVFGYWMGPDIEIDSGWHANLTAPCRLLCNSIFNYYSVYSSTKMVVFGYWMGPDIEDGWGYVEAAIDRTFT